MLAQRENDFVLAARSVGVRESRDPRAHILPNSISPVIVAGTLALATAIIDVAGLGFLGLGRRIRRRRVGHDADGHEPLPADGAVPRDHPRRRDRHLGARLQPDRRRAARGPRPEAPRPCTEPLLDRSTTCSVEFWTDRGTIHAVNGVSFDVAPGETLGLVGESGCGKSVTSLALLGILPARRSRHGRQRRFDGRDLLALERPAAAHGSAASEIAMVFQDPMTSLNPVLTIGRQIREALETHFGHEPEGGDGARG